MWIDQRFSDIWRPLKWFKSKEIGVRIEAEGRRKAQHDLWMIALKTQKKKFLLVSYRDGWWKMDMLRCAKNYGAGQELSTSMAKLNIHDAKLMLYIWWDQLVYYELPRRNHYWGTLSTIKPSIEAKTARLREKT